MANQGGAQQAGAAAVKQEIEFEDAITVGDDSAGMMEKGWNILENTVDQNPEILGLLVDIVLDGPRLDKLLREKKYVHIDKEHCSKNIECKMLQDRYMTT